MPYSKVPMRHLNTTSVREGVTLLEVVFSIGVATIGLLAAVALLPVAARQVELGLIADQTAAAGEAAQQSAEIIGVRHPLLWRTFVFNGTNYVPGLYGRDTRYDIDVDPGFRQAAYDANVLLQPSTGTQRFAPLSRPIYNTPVGGMSIPVNGICIDPFLLGDTVLRATGNAGAICDAPNADVRTQHFNSTADLQLFPYYSRHPYDVNLNNAPTMPIFNLRRVSLAMTAGGLGPIDFAMSSGQVESLFTIPDDVTITRPEADRTLPGMQQMVTVDDTTSGLRFAVKREAQRDLSWMVTLVPLFNGNNASTYSATTTTGDPGNAADDRQVQINNNFGTNTTYTMSIVVHRRRTPPRLNVIPGSPASYAGATGPNRNGLSGQPSDEMVAYIAEPLAPLGAQTGPQATGPRGFLSGGFGGGEVVIESPLDNPTPLNHIRPNDWVLLSGVVTSTNASYPGLPVPPPNTYLGTSRDVTGSAVFQPAIQHQWYRVVNVGDMTTVGPNTDLKLARYVTLEGPDWQVGNMAAQVTIVPSVVAVFEKTVTLAVPLQ